MATTAVSIAAGAAMPRTRRAPAHQVATQHSEIAQRAYVALLAAKLA
jgi:hypothetical protein